VIIAAGPADLEEGYEALRAQAVGEIPGHTPRGMALFLSRGMVAWMCASPPLPRQAAVGPTRSLGVDRAPAGVSRELVRVLAEMALRSESRWATA